MEVGIDLRLSLREALLPFLRGVALLTEADQST